MVSDTVPEAMAGTATTRVVGLTKTKFADVAPNLTALAPARFFPVTVIADPADPLVAESLEMVGSVEVPVTTLRVLVGVTLPFGVVKTIDLAPAETVEGKAK